MVGSRVSAVGDTLTWVALVWLVIETDGTDALGGLVVAYTAPVIVGGLAMGVVARSRQPRWALTTDERMRTSP